MVTPLIPLQHMCILMSMHEDCTITHLSAGYFAFEVFQQLM